MWFYLEAETINESKFFETEQAKFMAKLLAGTLNPLLFKDEAK